MKKWIILRNLWILWKNRNLLEKTHKTVQDYGFVEETILDDCTVEEKDGVEYLSSLYKMLTMTPKAFKEEIEIIKAKYVPRGKRK